MHYNNEVQSPEPTYQAATATPVTVPAGTKSFFVLMGSATKLIKISRIHVSGLTLTASAYNNVVIRKISSIPSGGTSSSLIQTPSDSIFPLGTASICKIYTVEPTTDGTLVGTLQSQKILMQDTVAKAGDPNTEIHFNFEPAGRSSGVILRGINDGISVAFSSIPASAVTLSLEI